MDQPDAGVLGETAARLVASVGRFEIHPGLTEVEFAAVTQQFGFEFADDHRSFLALGLPGGPGWPNWRDGDPDELADRLRWPVDGVLFDVAHNGFWYAGWGVRPGDVTDAVLLAERRLAEVPQLVPVYSHRFLPAGAGSHGHPVLSVVQTDIVRYGETLPEYLAREFDLPTEPAKSSGLTVAFWRDLVD